MELIIRETALENVEEHVICHTLCWQSAYKGIIPNEYLENMSMKQKERIEKKRQYLVTPGHGNHCVIYNNRTIGVLAFGKCRDDDRPNSGEIYGIYLLEEFWGKGYGTELIDFALGALKVKGYNNIVLWVLEDNVRARRFYEKHGFIFDGATKEIVIGKPLIEIRYSLDCDISDLERN